MKKFLLSLAAVAMVAGSAMADDLTITWANEGYENGVDVVKYENAPVSIVFDKGSSANPPKYYTTGSGVRMYNGNTVTFSVADGYVLNKIQLLASGTNYIVKGSFSNGSMSTEGTTVTWTASNDETTSTVLSTTSTSRNQTFVITYSEVAGDLLPANLSFPESAYTAVFGEDFDSPVLTKDTDAAVTYTSSNEDVATVDSDGVVTIIAAGTTTITAKAEKNETYTGGSASYTLTVAAAATSISEFMSITNGDTNVKVIMNFPMTVTYQTGIHTYVEANGEYGYIYGSVPAYEEGDVIPAGWTARYSLYGNIPEIIPVTAPGVAEDTEEVVIPIVESVNEDMLNQVVILSGVVISDDTPGSDASAAALNFKATWKGVEYTFRNNFKIASVPAGTYDVKAAVEIYNNTLQLYVIEFAEEGSLAVEGINAAEEGVATYYNLQGARVANPENGIFVRVLNGKATKVVK